MQCVLTMFAHSQKENHDQVPRVRHQRRQQMEGRRRAQQRKLAQARCPSRRRLVQVASATKSALIQLLWTKATATTTDRSKTDLITRWSALTPTRLRRSTPPPSHSLEPNGPPICHQRHSHPRRSLRSSSRRTHRRKDPIQRKKTFKKRGLRGGREKGGCKREAACVALVNMALRRMRRTTGFTAFARDLMTPR